MGRVGVGQVSGVGRGTNLPSEARYKCSSGAQHVAGDGGRTGFSV